MGSAGPGSASTGATNSGLVAGPVPCFGGEAAPGTQNNDHNPQRIQPRNLFDIAVGYDNLFKGDRYKWSLRFTVINLSDKIALYNFISTFSGTHYVTPRTEAV
jgi:hypothetical protein